MKLYNKSSNASSVTSFDTLSPSPPCFLQLDPLGTGGPILQCSFPMSLHLDQLHGMLLWKTIPSHRPQVNATHTQPSTYPQYESRSRTNLGVEASTNIMGPVDHNIPNSRPWNVALALHFSKVLVIHTLRLNIIQGTRGSYVRGSVY